jgi:hypothetical protein
LIALSVDSAAAPASSMPSDQDAQNHLCFAFRFDQMDRTLALAPSSYIALLANDQVVKHFDVEKVSTPDYTVWPLARLSDERDCIEAGKKGELHLVVTAMTPC